MRDDAFTTTAGIINLHPTQGTHWVMFSIKFRKMIVFVQRIVCMLYLTNIFGFKNAVLTLYYQNL